MQDDSYRAYFPACGHGASPALFMEDAVFFSMCALGIFVKCQTAIVVCIHILVFYFVQLVFVSTFVTISCCFYEYNSVIYLETCSGNHCSNAFLPLRVDLAILGSST